MDNARATLVAEGPDMQLFVKIKHRLRRMMTDIYDSFGPGPRGRAENRLSMGPGSVRVER
jgi:hypothetical protein